MNVAAKAKILVKSAFMPGVDRWDRLILASGYLFCAVAPNAWTAAAWVLMWSLIVQWALSNTYMKGWAAGLEWLELLDASTTVATVSMEDMLSLCDRHGVPMEEFAKVVWKEGR